MKNALLVVGVLLASQIVMAEEGTQTPTEKREQVIDNREANQEKRIEQGEKSGQVTPGEAKRLQAEQNRIKKMEGKAEADGKVTKKEMRRIEKAQNRASTDIYKKKHNKRKQ